MSIRKSGLDTPTETEKASSKIGPKRREWFKRAAARMSRWRSFEIANLFAEQNDEKAEIEWTRKAADHGFPPPCTALDLRIPLAMACRQTCLRHIDG